MTLHNAMLDSGASHNLMPKVIMETLGLQVTRPYKDLFSFDSKRFQCVGLIKDVVVGLTQIAAKTIVMDIVVADIPPKFGMLLSRSWAAKIKGTMQMDLAYATIPVFGEQRRLYRETRMAYMVSSKDKPKFFPIYSFDTGLGSAILFSESVDGELEEMLLENQHLGNQQEDEKETMSWWSLYFDGSAGREGAGAGIWITSPNDDSKFYSYKLNFDCTNNMAEYEYLILGLEVLLKLKARNIFVFGDSELVIKQVEGAYQTKDVRMRAYRNLVLDMLEKFQAYSFTIKTRDQNSIADSLAVSASLFVIPIHSSEKYEVEVRHRPAIPDNITNWQVFEDDQQVKNFIELKEEFESTQVDQ